MSIEHSHVLHYGLILTEEQCRDGLRALGKPHSRAVEDGSDYVEEPYWDLAMALGLRHEAVGDAYAEDPEAYVIGPKLIFDDGQATIRCDPDGLARIRAFAAQHFPDESPGWVLGMHRH